MNSVRTLETAISEANVKDQVAAFLYSIGVVQDNQDIVDIEFGNKNDGIIPLKIKLKEDLEVGRHGAN